MWGGEPAMGMGAVMYVTPGAVVDPRQATIKVHQVGRIKLHLPLTSTKNKELQVFLAGRPPQAAACREMSQALPLRRLSAVPVLQRRRACMVNGREITFLLLSRFHFLSQAPLFDQLCPGASPAGAGGQGH